MPFTAIFAANNYDDPALKVASLTRGNERRTVMGVLEVQEESNARTVKAVPPKVAKSTHSTRMVTDISWPRWTRTQKYVANVVHPSSTK